MKNKKAQRTEFDIPGACRDCARPQTLGVSCPVGRVDELEAEVGALRYREAELLAALKDLVTAVEVATTDITYGGSEAVDSAMDTAEAAMARATKGEK